ncbi:UbiA family prenyltransferase [Halolamina salifodinae]|uniref:4-hydroxybenzoate polyprenyltransferase n=2 Tax=Halolamina salifodinae TaxID=1202767 RepID=A0A8T4H1J3_9EURY|nr:UbiA family prenyltransferase [Halolamina salifodinae]MBP1988213.1 4-hydroxybenzoate polyprenyltransferase [Halolamina salifodinae]
MGRVASLGVRQQIHAMAVVSRLSATIGYNVASVLLGVGIGVRVGGLPIGVTAWVAAGYAVATMLAKLQASVADAIHDRAADATNPGKNVIAAAVVTLGVRRAWALLAGYLVAALALYAAVAVVAGTWVLLAGVAVIVFGFTYSYPPRFKERGVWNHVVTTGADAGLLVLPIAALVGGRLTPSIVLAVGVVACYSFGYHVIHQAADVYFDRQAGISTFATAIGVDTTVAVAAVATGAATGFAFALGYVLAAVVLGCLTAFYVDLFYSIQRVDPETASRELTDRFSIAWVATLANGALAAAVWRRVLGYPVVDALLA